LSAATIRPAPWHLHDDIELVRCAYRLGFDGIAKGAHYSAHLFESVQQVPFLAYCAAIAPRLQIICGLLLAPRRTSSLKKSDRCSTGPRSSCQRRGS
jgi:alkanesulfonate monooxygenase SsuD/methylene tetrahydromethanopterin reductase-like flavin-dependent oxidoreductase (luciferase family)